MKPKLKVFEEFSKALLPHEARYLQSLANFQDAEKRNVFQNLVDNSLNPEQESPFDPDIDKRKYHHIKTWAEHRLSLRDVDKVADWLLDFDKKLALDLVTSEEEKAVLDYVKNYREITFNFQILYRILRDYRSYLLIRMRYDDHVIILDFLEKWKEVYVRANEIQEKLYQATTEITDQFTKSENSSAYWEKWLHKVFASKNINGNNRYKAFILLAFMYNNTGNLEKLQQIFDKIDGFFNKGTLYCRRLLYNYYSSRVLLHSKQRDFEAAVYYGKLSIRQLNEDTLMYINNLVSIYLRLDQQKKALNLLEDYRSIYENTHNDLQKIIYISYYLRALNELNLSRKAENIAIYFLQKYETEILKLRWHHFFTSYFTALLNNENYAAILQLDKKYSLTEKELTRKGSVNYVPNILWAFSVAAFLENKISEEKLFSNISESLADVDITDHNREFIEKNVKILSKNLPELKVFFKSYLRK
ncbi:MAG: hypothetical protein I8H68_04790 [Flavobacteriia bacterium]|nr:hypothetical protein [Flavobacteriia bacterium]MBH2022885.1 hypothetical protein [Flavobacteriales bacterium]